jgi:hypothetical protein
MKRIDIRKHFIFMVGTSHRKMHYDLFLIRNTYHPFHQSGPSGEFDRLALSLREPDVRPPGDSTLPGYGSIELERIAKK